MTPVTTAILINTTTKYLPLVGVQLMCIKRYAPELLQYNIYVASESVPEFLDYKFPCAVRKIPLLPDESGFLESRIAAVKYLVEEDTCVNAVLMLQDDFWIDRPINMEEWKEAQDYICQDTRVQSIRLMPCPGPVGTTQPGDLRGPYIRRAYITEITDADEYRFTFQATLWRPECIVGFLEEVLKEAQKKFRAQGYAKEMWNAFCIRYNVAENATGQDIFLKTCMGPNKFHLGIRRKGQHPNAVYLATIPYRPTAVVQGKLESWAKEMAIREGFKNLEGWY
jgi:hypothetical protein